MHENVRFEEQLKALREVAQLIWNYYVAVIE